MKGTAVVVGASRGLGLALCSEILRRHKALNLVACARTNSEQLLKLKDESNGRLRPIQCDVTDATSLKALTDATENVQMLLNVVGVLHSTDSLGVARMPERSLREVDAAWMAQVYAVNAIGPVLATQALRSRLSKGAVVANLSARVGSIGDNKLGGWWSYRMSKSALNQATRNMAIELKRSEVKVVSLHPGTTDTDLSRPFQKNVRPEKLFSPEKTAGMLLDVLENLRPEDTGGFFDYSGSRIEW